MNTISHGGTELPAGGGNFKFLAKSRYVFLCIYLRLSVRNFRSRLGKSSLGLSNPSLLPVEDRFPFFPKILYLSIMFWKTQPPYIVSIPQPCHENWQGMTLAERGRFCQACQTVVTDFTALSDEEIIRHIEQAGGDKMCGRFLNEQIDRPLLPEIKAHRISHFRKMAASVFLFYASISEALAQVPVSQHHTYTSTDTKTPVPKLPFREG